MKQKSQTGLLLVNARQHGLVTLLGLQLVMVSSAWCQTPPNAGSLLKELDNSSRPAVGQTAPTDPVVSAPERTTIKMSEGLSVKVTGFRVTGASSFSQGELLELLTPWVGQTLDLNALNEAAGAITRHYQSNGHVLSYAYLPAQKIADGTLDIAVLEGRLDTVQIVAAQDVRLQDEVVQAHVGNLSQAVPVSQPDVERRLLLLNDIPGVVARGSFTPGASTGSADMVVSIAEDEPLATQFEFNNHGSVSTGEYWTGASFHFKDLFGVGDSSRARLVASTSGDMVNASFNTRMPVGGRGWSVGAGISRLTYELGGSFVSLGGVGEATVLNLNTAYPLIRSYSRNLNFSAGFDKKKLKDEIQLTAVINPKDSSIFSTGLSYDQRDAWVGGGSLAASLNLFAGQLSFADAAQQTTDQAGLKTGGDFAKLGFDLSRQQTIKSAWGMFGRLSGQVANKNLDSTEKFSLTGPSAVRAYAVGESSVDSGQILAFELRHSLPYVGGALQWSLFHDHAWGRINTTPLAGATGNAVGLYGNGIGLQWSGGADMGVNASLAWRGSRAPISGARDDAPRLYLQIFKNL